MYIKEIILDGFKCYEQVGVVGNLDKTFNAITGMNGSGKSNVIDGILFALGLEGSKVLRAENMRELINIHRKECKVTLVMNNSDKKHSPPGYEQHNEIRISRTIDSEGKSKYFLNNHSCSLSTLTKLCTSMGISSTKGTYSFIIMQGQITKVLNMKSKELKSLIEETAGTRPYEKEREKAILALEKKEEKLKDVRDTLKRRISPFYGKLREERAIFVEQRNLEEMREHNIKRMYEIKELILANNLSTGIYTLNQLITEFLKEKEDLNAVEREMEELENLKDEDDTVWIKTSMDEEKFKLEELQSRNIKGVLSEKTKELEIVKKFIPKYDINILKEREKILLDDLKRAGISLGKDNPLEKIEELSSLKLQKSKLQLSLNATSNVIFSEERLNFIESLKVDERRLEDLIKKHRVLKSKINYPFIKGVFGTVEESFEVIEEKYKEAVYTVLGGRSKYVITTDDKVGSEILKSSDKNISIIPLSKIITRTTPSHVLKQVKINKGKNMVDLLNFDSKIRKAIEFIFGGFFLFENKEVARKICFEYNLLCVTLDGTVYDPKGTLTGGKANIKMDIVKKAEIDALEKKIVELENNSKAFYQLSDEYNQLIKNKNIVEKRKALENEFKSISEKINLLDQLCGNKMDAKKELGEVRKKIVEASKEAILIEKNEALQQNLISEIESLKQEEKEINEAIGDICSKIEGYNNILAEQELKRSSRRMSERAIEGLELKEKHLIKSSSRLESKIKKTYNELKKHVENSDQNISDRCKALFETINKINTNNINEEIIKKNNDIKPICSEQDEETLLKEKAHVEELLEKCKHIKMSTMNPSNFDLLEKNELAIEELKEKIEKLEKDRTSIINGILKFNDLGQQENEKAYKHINARLGRFLQYFISGSDAKITKEGDDYGLKVKIGNWKDSLEELSGGQRSLVALCLMFSMLSYKPAPFYIFDEIDAALDLSYTQSIGEIIKKEFDNAQFIVVSLKNGMFDNANSVFKVFIQDGKSRVCKIK